MPKMKPKRSTASLRSILHTGPGVKTAPIEKQLEWLDLRGAYLRRVGWIGFFLIAVAIAIHIMPRAWVPGDATKIYYPAPLQVLLNTELAHGVRRPTENLIRRAEAGDVSDVKAILAEKKLLSQGYAHLLLFQVAKQSNSSLSGVDLPLAAKFAFDNKEVPTEVQINIELAAFGEVKSVRALDKYKSLKKCGVSQSFLDWSSTQEKSKQIVQITFNPTAQAVAGMSNFARRGSWNGHNGTSCQDTRHSETYTRSLVGAIADDTMYSIQMNYLEDNDYLSDSIEEIMEEEKCSFEKAFDMVLEDYDITDDILYRDNFQDKLRARVLGKVWNLQEQKNYYNEYDSVDDELEGLMQQFFELGLDLDFMKTIRGYGSDKTKSELKDALTQISKIENLIATGIK